MSTNRGESEKALKDLSEAVREGEELLSEAMGGEGENGRALRAKLEAAVDKAREMYDRLQEKTVEAAKATDKTIRAHPYESIGVAFGVGLLVGVLVMRNRRD